MSLHDREDSRCASTARGANDHRQASRRAGPSAGHPANGYPDEANQYQALVTLLPPPRGCQDAVLPGCTGRMVVQARHCGTGSRAMQHARP